MHFLNYLQVFLTLSQLSLYLWMLGNEGASLITMALLKVQKSIYPSMISIKFYLRLSLMELQSSQNLSTSRSYFCYYSLRNEPISSSISLNMVESDSTISFSIFFKLCLMSLSSEALFFISFSLLLRVFRVSSRVQSRIYLVSDFSYSSSSYLMTS